MSFSQGDQQVVTITDIAFGGEGIARVNDFVIFVPFVCLGETVVVELTDVKKRFARAKLIRIIDESPGRVRPLCPYFGECGGCQYQHMAYPAQLAAKGKQIADVFQRIGGLNNEVVQPVRACPQPYGYRNRIMIRSQWDKFKQGLNIGFIRHDNRLVIDIEECKIAEPSLSAEIANVRKNPPAKGGLKVVLRMRPENWEVPPDSFFQNNFHLLPELVAVVRGCLRAAGTRHLLDVYCGVGFFSLELADDVESYAGIELDQSAIRSARKNAANKGKLNGEFLAGAAEDLLPELISKRSPEKTTVVLDPPRKGCHPEMLRLITKVGPAQIIYVSCNPATMARDLNALCATGVFTVSKVIPLDMFPQTAHVECVADVRRREGITSLPNT